MKTPEIIPVPMGFVKAFIVKGEGAVVVDTGMKDGPKKILAALASHGLAPKDVRLIVITHAHADHYAGLAELKAATGAPVAVHSSEAECLRTGGSAPVVMHSAMMKLVSRLFGKGKIDPVEPDVLVGDRLELAQYGIDGYLLHTPGHSPGSITLITSAGDALTGDMVGLGRGKEPGIPGVYNDLEQLKSSIQAVLAAGAKRVFTCHGGVYGADVVRKLTEH